MPSEFAKQFIPIWDREAQHALELMRALPPSQYDFRPDPKGRSLGEMAWHLAEIDAFMTCGIEAGKLGADLKPPGIERPRTIGELAPGYERVHREAVARIEKLSDDQVKRSVTMIDGRPMKVEDMLWHAILHHHVHHRGQLVLLTRMAGGKPTGIYGPSREESEAMRSRT